LFLQCYHTIESWTILKKTEKPNFRNVLQQHHSIGWKATDICIEYISCTASAIPSCIIYDLKETTFPPWCIVSLHSRVRSWDWMRTQNQKTIFAVLECLKCNYLLVWQASLSEDSAGRKYCEYDSDIATGLGVGSLFILVASQVIIMVVTRCLCCGKAMRPTGSRSWAICLFITSWYVFIFGSYSFKHKFTCLL